MQLIAILRHLWRRRLAVAIGFAVALGIGTLMTYGLSGFPPKVTKRTYTVGIASTGVLVDSSSSQVADLGNGKTRADAASLSVRAKLLANLLAASPLRERIARRAGIAPETLIAVAPSDDAVSPSSDSSPGVTVTEGDRRASILTLSVRPLIPIITATTTAPDRATAGRLANAAVLELDLYLKNTASSDRVPDSQRLVIDTLGSAHSATATRGPRRLLVVIMSMFVLGFWCAGILVFDGLARGWRDAAALESADTSSVSVDQPPLAGPSAAAAPYAPPGPRARTIAPPSPERISAQPERPVQRDGGMVA